MAMDKKKAALIIALGAPPKESSKEADHGEEDDAGLQSAAEEILQAVADKDASALKDALKSFCELCDSDYSEE